MSSFKRARTKEQFEERKEKIVSIAMDLYDKDGYGAVNFSTISKLTNFTRPAIYSYFKNPDDILIYVLGKDFCSLNRYLEDKLESTDSLGVAEFTDVIYNGIISYPRMLKMLSINYSIIELGCTEDELITFKSYIMRTFELLGLYVSKFFSHVSEEQKVDFEFLIFTFISSVYIITHPSERQTKAIKRNNDTFTVPAFEHLCKEGIKAIVKTLAKK